MSNEQKEYRQWCREGFACQGCSYNGTTAGPHYTGPRNGQATVTSALRCPHCRVYLDVDVLLKRKWECPKCHGVPTSRKYCPACQQKAVGARNKKIAKAAQEAMRAHEAVNLQHVQRLRLRGLLVSTDDIGLLDTQRRCSQRNCWHLARAGKKTCQYHTGRKPDAEAQLYAALRRIEARRPVTEEEVRKLIRKFLKEPL